jgi:CheY-like chemotaxis protein
MTGRGRHIPRARHSLRRRVALAFAVAVVVATLALALSAYFITKAAQDADALDKALAQSRFNLVLADAMLPAVPETADYNRLLEALQIRGDFASLIEAGSDLYVSGPQVTRGLVTSDLAAKLAEGHIGYQMITMAGQPTIAVGGPVRSSEIALYFFYSQGDRLADLARLRNILIIGDGSEPCSEPSPGTGWLGGCWDRSAPRAKPPSWCLRATWTSGCRWEPTNSASSRLPSTR